MLVQLLVRRPKKLLLIRPPLARMSVPADTAMSDDLAASVTAFGILLIAFLPLMSCKYGNGDYPLVSSADLVPSDWEDLGKQGYTACWRISPHGGPRRTKSQSLRRAV